MHINFIILPWPSQFFKLTKNVTQNDHLTILNPASVSGIDHLRVLPPPLAIGIQVHLRVIHSTTTILCQYLIVHVWIERGGVAQSLLSTKTMP